MFQIVSYGGFVGSCTLQIGSQYPLGVSIFGSPLIPNFIDTQSAIIAPLRHVFKKPPIPKKNKKWHFFHLSLLFWNSERQQAASPGFRKPTRWDWSTATVPFRGLRQSSIWLNLGTGDPWWARSADVQYNLQKDRLNFPLRRTNP